MISKFDLIQDLKTSSKITSMYLYDEDNECIRSHDTNIVICTVDDLLTSLRKNYHCDFTCIYRGDEASLTVIYKCNECGTYIFSGDDERFDPDLCCPNCGHYEYDRKSYWTPEDIASDERKQKTIDFYIQAQKDLIEREKRYAARNGLYDFELWRKEFVGKRRYVRIELDNIYGLRLSILICKKANSDDIGYSGGSKRIEIPLSFKSFYAKFILPHLRHSSIEYQKHHFNK